MIRSSSSLLGALVLILKLFLALTGSAAANSNNSNKAYDPYCSTPDEQKTRQIPKLKTNTPLTNSIQKLNLLHVTTIIRHGSRTPYAPHKCWEGYDEYPIDTATWECTLTSMMRPQSEEAIVLQELVNGVTDQSTAESGKGLFFEFQKLYDANWSKNHPNHYPPNIANDLRGNCQKGQLIMKGHGQQIINGKILQSAYVTNSDDFTQADVATLYDFTDEISNTIVNERAYDEPNLYFRSDDDERTLMSGQLLLEQFFGKLMKAHEAHYKQEGKSQDRPVIRTHTSDRDKDILAPNYNTCPRLTEIEMEAIGSEEYQKLYVHSAEAKTMQELTLNEFGGLDRMQNPAEAVDCVMTTHCEDKTLPYVLDTEKSGNDQTMIDYYGDNIFDRYVNFNIEKVAYVFKYKNSIFSKTSTNPLWNDILSNLLVYTNANQSEMDKAWPDLRPKSKLALYSAHDTTIMSLLASLGPTVYGKSNNNPLWPPYASMLNIELYDIEWKNDGDANIDIELKEEYSTNVGFRLLYNGNVLNHYISGCRKDEDICDIDLLVLHVYSFANVTEWFDQCQTQSRNNGGGDNNNGSGGTDGNGNYGNSGNGNGLSNNRQIGGVNVALFLLGGLLCGVCGAFITYLYMSKSNLQPIRSLAARNMNNEHNHVEEQLSSLQMTPTTRTKTHMDQNGNGKIYGLPIEQEDRDII